MKVSFSVRNSRNLVFGQRVVGAEVELRCFFAVVSPEIRRIGSQFLNAQQKPESDNEQQNSN